MNEKELRLDVLSAAEQAVSYALEGTVGVAVIEMVQRDVRYAIDEAMCRHKIDAPY